MKIIKNQIILKSRKLEDLMFKYNTDERRLTIKQSSF